MKRSLMVPGSLSSALQTTYFSGLALLAHDFPLHAGRKSGAAQSAQGRWPSTCAITPSQSRVTTKASAARRRVRRPGYGSAASSPCFSSVGRHFGKFAAAQRGEHQRLGLRGADAAIDMIVDRNRGRAVALAQAGNVAHREIVVAHAAEALLQRRPSDRRRRARWHDMSEQTVILHFGRTA